MALPRLKQRREFLRVAGKGKRAARPSVLLQALPETEGPLRVGFTATKKLGNAVVRNRVTRRLREIVRPHLETLPAGSAIVLRALPGIEGQAFAELREDVDSALASASRNLARREERSR